MSEKKKKRSGRGNPGRSNPYGDRPGSDKPGIEDERVLCETIVRSLRRLAYSVDHCYDGDQALELLGTERYDLVLLDLNLPGKDGMTVLRTFRQSRVWMCHNKW